MVANFIHNPPSPMRSEMGETHETKWIRGLGCVWSSRFGPEISYPYGYRSRIQIDHAGVVQGTTSSRDSLILVFVDANGGEGSSLWAVNTDKLNSLVQLVSAYSRNLDLRDGLGLCEYLDDLCQGGRKMNWVVCPMGTFPVDHNPSRRK